MGNTSNYLWNAFSALFIVAVIYLLVKPNSLGPAFIKTSTEGFAALINYSTTG